MNKKIINSDGIVTFAEPFNPQKNGLERLGGKIQQVSQRPLLKSKKMMPLMPLSVMRC